MTDDLRARLDAAVAALDAAHARERELQDRLAEAHRALIEQSKASADIMKASNEATQRMLRTERTAAAAEARFRRAPGGRANPFARPLAPVPAPTRRDPEAEFAAPAKES